MHFLIFCGPSKKQVLRLRLCDAKTSLRMTLFFCLQYLGKYSDAVGNPYSHGAGTLPPDLAGGDGLREQVRIELLGCGMEGPAVFGFVQ